MKLILLVLFNQCNLLEKLFTLNIKNTTLEGKQLEYFLYYVSSTKLSHVQLIQFS